VAVGAARRVSLAEAADALRRANAAGLVHLGLYMPDHRLYALCSCCACCCHDLQLVQRFGRTDLLVRSDYVAVTDMDACRHCGDCVDRCVFGARTLEDGHVLHLPDACAGCGLCVTVCPAGATTMQPRAA
jgi:heterodisulfide reductase subunit A-like polyferredoxin